MLIRYVCITSLLGLLLSPYLLREFSFFPTRFLHSCVRPRWDDPKAVGGDWPRLWETSCSITFGRWSQLVMCSHWRDHFDFDRCYINDCKFQQFHQRDFRRWFKPWSLVFALWLQKKQQAFQLAVVVFLLFTLDVAQVTWVGWYHHVAKNQKTFGPTFFCDWRLCLYILSAQSQNIVPLMTISYTSRIDLLHSHAMKV